MLEVQLGTEAPTARELDFGEVQMNAARLVEAVEPVVAADAHVRPGRKATRWRNRRTIPRASPLEMTSVENPVHECENPKRSRPH